MAQPLLAVDLPSMLYRAFYALPDSIKGADGKPVNALLGSANLILQAVEEHDPRAVALCLGPDAAAYRTELYPAVPRRPRPRCPRASSASGRTRRRSSGPSAGPSPTTTRSRPTTCSAPSRGSRPRPAAPTLLMTGDRDMFQCATDAVTVLYVSTGKGRPGGATRRGRATLRGRARARPRLHRAARRPLRRAAGGQGRRREDGRRAAAKARLARGSARGGDLRARGRSCARRLLGSSDELLAFKRDRDAPGRRS